MPTAPLKYRNTASASKALPAPRGVYLILGWLTFWFGTAAYPCQAQPSPLNRPVPNAVFDVATNKHANPAHPDSHPAHDNGTCHHLGAPVIGALVIATAADSRNPNIDPAAPAALELGPLAAAASAPGIPQVSQPLPQAPLYLRTQRLLI